MAVHLGGVNNTQSGGNLPPTTQGPPVSPKGSGDSKSTFSRVPLEGGLKPASGSETSGGLPLVQVRKEQESGSTKASPPSSAASGYELVRARTEEDGSLAWRVAVTIGTILQHFAIRSPITFFSLSSVYLVTKHYFDQPALAVEAATFVGTAGAVYCLLRPFFLVTIPYRILSDSDKKHIVWREMINITNTVFITATLSSVVWGLKIPALNGTALWLGSFGFFYGISYKAFGNIDKAAFFP